MFKKVDPKQSFPELEKKILKFWAKGKVFEKSVQQRGKDNEYVFYDGPPFATGLPHYGHILAGTMKDVVPRYQTMRGHRVERVFGWDCHGLPVENVVEKQLNLNGKKEIEEKIGKHDFNEKCRAAVLKYTAEWEATVTRMGRWVDFKNDYKTMSSAFMETVWWVFKQLWDKGLIYKGHKTMHVCPHCVTPLSNFEVTLGYKDVKDPSVIWKFPLKGQKDTYVMAWTTTPWSSLSTMGLSVNPKFTYVKVRVGDEYVIFVKDRLDFVMKNVEDYEIVDEFKGEKLVGLEYEHFVDWFMKLPEVKGNKNVYRLFAEDYVEVSEGTGIVTINGAYGEVDYEAAQRNGLPIVMDVDMDGRFNSLGLDYEGLNVKEMQKRFIVDMQKRGLVFRTEPYKHSYPHCWRCDAPLLNYATASWFVNIQDVKKKMIAANKKVHWMPEHVGEGRFADWLLNARDWCVSRNRFWGTPLPIWVNEDDDADRICVGSIDELQKLSGKKVKDLHSHFVDEIVIEKKGIKYRRVPEVLDCWFESGSMPYAQFHYPFENKKKFDQNFPAEFIAEGLDQTRGWFYTLVVLGTALFLKSPFKNVIVNGLILAEDGKKMSKRMQNYPDPEKIFEEYGADALRFYLMNSPVVRAEPLRFSEKGVEDVVRRILLPIWNSYYFFVTYSNIDRFKPNKDLLDSVPVFKNKLDRWIISELEKLLRELTREMDNYDLQRATEPVVNFVESLTKWYIRRSRRRFWKSDSDDDKNDAYNALYYCLVRLSQIIAPFMPFIAEEIYRNLTGDLSVHLSDWPAFDDKKIDLKLNEEMDLVRRIVSLGHTLRANLKIKVRQPLRMAKIALPEGVDFRRIVSEKEVILEELNVKELEFLADFDAVVECQIKVDASVLGPKYGADVQKIIVNVKNGDFAMLPDGGIEVEIVREGGKLKKIHLADDEVEIGYKAKEGYDAECDGGVVITLDKVIDADLRKEGYAREVVRCIQDMRKEADYNVDDRIFVLIDSSGELDLAVTQFSDYIQAETLANEIMQSGDVEWDKERKVMIDDFKAKIAIRR
ncbi:isoleucine--tRNA ligase [Candidatus Peregrinibacteria bacterium]|nr:isoleucine--tRNA ligase [Candidatus Peregrinibacteria bacterium]